MSQDLFARVGRTALQNVRVQEAKNKGARMLVGYYNKQLVFDQRDRASARLSTFKLDSSDSPEQYEAMMQFLRNFTRSEYGDPTGWVTAEIGGKLYHLGWRSKNAFDEEWTAPEGEVIPLNVSTGVFTAPAGLDLIPGDKLRVSLTWNWFGQSGVCSPLTASITNYACIMDITCSLYIPRPKAALHVCTSTAGISKEKYLAEIAGTRVPDKIVLQVGGKTIKTLDGFYAPSEPENVLSTYTFPQADDQAYLLDFDVDTRINYRDALHLTQTSTVDMRARYNNGYGYAYAFSIFSPSVRNEIATFTVTKA